MADGSRDNAPWFLSAPGLALFAAAVFLSYIVRQWLGDA